MYTDIRKNTSRGVIGALTHSFKHHIDLNPNYPGRGRNYHPLSENRDSSGTEPPLDLRPVCRLKFVRCGPGEKKTERSIFLG